MPAKNSKSKNFNLLPQNKFDASLFGRILKWTLSTFRIVVIFVELIVITGFLTRFYLDIRHTDLNDEIEQKQAIIASYSRFEREFRLTQDKLTLWALWSSPDHHFSQLLQKVTRHLPLDVQLTSLNNQDGIVTIEVNTISEESVTQFVTNLRQEPELSTISVVTARIEEGKPYLDLTLRTNPTITTDEES